MTRTRPRPSPRRQASPRDPVRPDARLLERAGDVVGERTGGETTGNGLGACVRGKFEDGTLAIGTGRDDANVRGVVDGNDNPRSQNDLLPEGGCQ